DEVTATARNNAAPVLGVFLELVTLKGIDLVANEAGDPHRYPPGWHGGRITNPETKTHTRCHEQLYGLAPGQPVERNRDGMHVQKYASCGRSTLRSRSKCECRNSHPDGSVSRITGNDWGTGANSDALLPGRWAERERAPSWCRRGDS